MAAIEAIAQNALLFAGLWALAGWVAGALASRFAWRLIAVDEPLRARPTRVPMIGPLGVDVWHQGLAAVAFALLALSHGPELSLLIFSVSALSLTTVLVVDARTRYVYNLVAYPAIAFGVALTPFATDEPLWSGLAAAAIGAGLMGILRLLGRWRYRGQEAIASGDITIAALVGATTGLYGVLLAMMMGAIFGGAIAIGLGLARRSLRGTMPYGPGLCLGALAMLFQTG